MSLLDDQEITPISSRQFTRARVECPDDRDVHPTARSLRRPKLQIAASHAVEVLSFNQSYGRSRAITKEGVIQLESGMDLSIRSEWRRSSRVSIHLLWKVSFVTSRFGPGLPVT